MRIGKLLTATVLALGLAAPLSAYQSDILFQHKHWKVDIHAWDDGAFGCRAIVGSEQESFAIWVFHDGSFQLQFYSTAWDFGEGQTADLQVQVDTRPRWDLTAARLAKNSVTFNLPDSDGAVEFVMEIAKGNKLFLRAKDGKDVQNYSLAGSRASIDSLLECGNVIMENGGETGATTNPFK